MPALDTAGGNCIFCYRRFFSPRSGLPRRPQLVLFTFIARLHGRPVPADLSFTTAGNGDVVVLFIYRAWSGPRYSAILDTSFYKNLAFLASPFGQQENHTLVKVSCGNNRIYYFPWDTLDCSLLVCLPAGTVHGATTR